MRRGSTAPGNSTVPSGNSGIRASTLLFPPPTCDAESQRGRRRQRTTVRSGSPVRLSGPSGVAAFQQHGGDDEQDGGPQAKDAKPLPGREQVVWALFGL